MPALMIRVLMAPAARHTQDSTMRAGDEGDEGSARETPRTALCAQSTTGPRPRTEQVLQSRLLVVVRDREASASRWPQP
jgi:hypothetical protein